MTAEISTNKKYFIEDIENKLIAIVLKKLHSLSIICKSFLY